jgi:phosphatidylglycerophosphate synthase
MPRRRRRTFELVKHAIFLTVALGGTAYVVVHLGELGWWGVAALAIGVSMLTIYALEQVRRRGREGPAVRRLGDRAVLVAVAAACFLLLLVVLDGVRKVDLGRVAVAGVFLITFGRIMRDQLRHGTKRGRSTS